MQVLVGDCRRTLQDLEDCSVQCCVTTAPRWARGSDLPEGHPDRACDLGLIASPYTYLVELVRILRQVRRVLTHDGTLWLRVRDVYRPKGLCDIRGLFGFPWRAAIALQADRWSLQADLSAEDLDRSADSDAGWLIPPRDHVLLFSKTERYYCNAGALSHVPHPMCSAGSAIRAGSRPGDTVLDPFGGDGLTACSARFWDRESVTCELNPERASALRETLEPIERTP